MWKYYPLTWTPCITKDNRFSLVFDVKWKSDGSDRLPATLRRLTLRAYLWLAYQPTQIVLNGGKSFKRTVTLQAFSASYDENYKVSLQLTTVPSPCLLCPTFRPKASLSKACKMSENLLILGSIMHHDQAQKH